jgi:hypothetical protein
MVELAKANGIGVVLASVMPAFNYPWRPGVAPAVKIVALNQRLQHYAAAHDVVYLDHRSAMADERQGLRAERSSDWAAPERAGLPADGTARGGGDRARTGQPGFVRRVYGIMPPGKTVVMSEVALAVDGA